MFEDDEHIWLVTCGHNLPQPEAHRLLSKNCLLLETNNSRVFILEAEKLVGDGNYYINFRDIANI